MAVSYCSVRYASFLALFLASIAPAFAQASNTPRVKDLPPFLAPYYDDAVAVLGNDFALTGKENKDNVSRYRYESADQVKSIEFANFPCERDRCKVLYTNAVGYFDKLLTENSGQFRRVTPTEFAAIWQTGLADNYAFVAKMPKSLLFATYSARLARDVDSGVFFAKLLIAVDRQRYETAQSLDPIQKGLWAKAANDYADHLLQGGRKDDALTVLQNIATAAPFLYDAQFELVENTHDSTLARNAATSVYDNSEDSELVAKAARYLGRTVPDISALPVLDKDKGGLHVVLIALPPCDVRLLTDAGALYEKITGITMRVVRLPEQWEFNRPERIPDQRRIQQAIIQKRGPNIDFNGWSRDRYKTELLDAITTGDALTKYNTEQFVTRLDARPVQYDGGPYVKRLAGIISKYQATDSHAIYVGVTGADLFLGDTYYVFSTSIAMSGRTTRLVSYYRMTTKSTGERYESRKRLTERLAKQLVPPTLSALGIARPTDPTDPDSYADSVARVDEKTLTLCEPTKQALDKFR
ncbi:MAG TPA: hypothetical protein VGJ20_01930 [Xanthobacteraceae bacterium]|jgi:predicted Zn-dependent protease